MRRMKGAPLEPNAPNAPKAPVRLEIGGETYRADTPGLSQRIALAYWGRQRPRCLCTERGAEMYIARVGDSYRVKRMPGTGSQHATACLSYEPPSEWSGLGQVLGTAIVENPDTGETQLRLGFSLSKRPGSLGAPGAGLASAGAKSAGVKLSMGALLHYLWDQAELTRWHPGFEGRRTWGVVRRQLLEAAARKVTGGRDLLQVLYVPEPFVLAQRDAIDARRLSHWRQAQSGPPGSSSLVLIIGELKDMGPARFGYRAFIKHLPDLPLSIDEKLLRSASRHFSAELALWSGSDATHLLIIGTVALGISGTPELTEFALMVVNDGWLPVVSTHDKRLLDTLIQQGRTFLRPLPYNLPQAQMPANVLLTDVGALPVPLVIRHAAASSALEIPAQVPSWLWDPSQLDNPPALPVAWREPP